MSGEDSELEGGLEYKGIPEAGETSVPADPEDIGVGEDSPEGDLDGEHAPIDSK